MAANGNAVAKLGAGDERQVLAERVGGFAAMGQGHRIAVKVGREPFQPTQRRARVATKQMLLTVVTPRRAKPTVASFIAQLRSNFAAENPRYGTQHFGEDDADKASMFDVANRCDLLVNLSIKKTGVFR